MSKTVTPKGPEEERPATTGVRQSGNAEARVDDQRAGRHTIYIGYLTALAALLGALASVFAVLLAR